MAEFHMSHEVCTCKKVSLGEVLHSIKEKGADNIGKIGKLSDAGTVCGCCKSARDDFGEPKKELYLEQILKKFKNG
jgi:NAD(P)H-nitrite reductase large subunit